MDASDRQLLEDFAQTRSQEAFAELVRRYVDLVYSAARRQLRDPADADDATQAVFVLLGGKAKGLGDVQLSGWLFKTTRFVCNNSARKSARRRNHEHKASTMKPETHEQEQSSWERFAPLLDEAIDSLASTERDLVLLHFFEKRTLKQLGEQLQISDDAARKRVDRAVEKLRGFFTNVGIVSIPSAALEAMLIAHVVDIAAPAHLVAQVASNLPAISTGAISKFGVIMAATTGKKVVAVAIIAILICGSAAVVLPSILRRITPAHKSSAQVPIEYPAIGTVTKTDVGVELVGLSNETDGQPWWTPNGAPRTSPYSEKDFRWFSEMNQKYSPEGAVLIVVRAMYLSPTSQQEPLAIQPIAEPSSDGTSWETPDPKNGNHPGISRIKMCWNSPPEKVDLAIRVASGPWSSVVESTTPMAVTKHRIKPGNEGEMEFSALVPTDGRAFRAAKPPDKPKKYCQMELRYSIKLWTYGVDHPETRAVAVMADGKEVVAKGVAAGGIPGAPFGELIEFQVPPEKIVAVKFQKRDYEPVIFQNVSLRPGAHTNPTVSLRPIVSQPAL